jgi:mono/diheme cytochrome c family protein
MPMVPGRRALWLVALVLLLAIAIVSTALRGRAATPSFSRDALAATFESDLRRVSFAWDPDDPRSAAEQRQALFDFTYQTYDAAAWIPQSLFDSNLVTQAVVGDVDTIVGEQVGLVLWRDNARVPAFGMAPNAVDAGATTAGRAAPPLRWTVNCLVCHTAEIDGVAYLGAGTKTFDELWLGEALKKLTRPEWRRLLRSGSGDDALAAEAHRILNSHHHDKIDSLTRARSTAFAASHVELYMRPHNGVMPRVEEVGRGDVKTPPLWHTVAKMPSGRWYTDGSFHGPFPLMASSMELEKDRSFDALMQVVLPRIKDEFEAVVRHLRPPVYPYEIDRALAERGRRLFESPEVGCARCHGTYDGRGNVTWPGVHADVGTDRSRLDVVSAGFVDAFNHSPIAAEGALVPSEGYAATPLTGVWANYPYLHNGSVPTLHHLLGPVAERPKIFEVMAAKTLDRVRVGQPLVRRPSDARLDEPDLLRRYGGDRNWFSILRPGCGNGGHDVWPRIRTDENRRALIEYLKTL